MHISFARCHFVGCPKYHRLCKTRFPPPVINCCCVPRFPSLASSPCQALDCLLNLLVYGGQILIFVSACVSSGAGIPPRSHTAVRRQCCVPGAVRLPRPPPSHSSSSASRPADRPINNKRVGHQVHAKPEEAPSGRLVAGLDGMLPDFGFLSLPTIKPYACQLCGPLPSGGLVLLCSPLRP